MKTQRILLFGVLVVGLLSIENTVFGGLINYDRVNKKSKPSSSAPSKSAQPQEQSSPKWMTNLPSVTNKDEQKYDINRDGHLQTAEVKIFLRDVLDTVNEKGGFTVNSSILREYDKNRDGFINKYEAADIRAHVR